MKKLLFLIVLLAFTSSFYTNQDTEQKSFKKINLYVYPGCPYCKKVIKFLQKNDWLDNVHVINANIAENYAQLKKLSKNTQCPFLQDEKNDVSMLESKEIIEYLNTLFKKS